MDTIDIFHLTWGSQPVVVRWVLISQFALVLISAVRFVKSARCLYRYSGERILPEAVLRGEADPDHLAADALASRALFEAVLEMRASPQFPKDRVSAQMILHILRAADCRFAYLWDICQADVESTRRASLLTFLLSLVMVAYATSPIYFGCWNESKVTGPTCLFLTGSHLLVLLALGWSCCTVLYVAFSFFERKLASRKTCWNYFCSRLKNELPRE